MTDYSKFSVHDLLCEALALQEREQLMGDREPFTDAMQTEIEAALRSAVIREASVGTVYIARDYDDGCPEFRFKCPESLTGEVKGQHICKLCGELMPERQYALVPSNLIPKETP